MIMIDQRIIKEIIIDFHNRPIPDLIPRLYNLKCPQNKIRSLIGPRRSGKTFTFFQLIKELHNQNIQKERILYINFEDERLLPLEVSDLGQILNTYYELYPDFKEKKIYLFLDEIQNVCNWEKFVRRVHDNENVQINLTGSSSKLLSKELSTTLRGRTLAFEIFPFNFAEYLQYHKISADFKSSQGRSKIINAFEGFYFKGGFPEILNFQEPFRIKTIQEYFNMILYKDLIERYDVRNHSLMKYLLKFLLSNNANPFSVNKFYQDSRSQGYKCSKDALHNYLSYLEDAFCFSLIPIFTESIKKRQINYRKVYAVDHRLITGIVSSLSYNTGRLLETMVYNQLRRVYSFEEIFYYKTSKNQEVDFLITKQGTIHSLIQVSEIISGIQTEKRETNAMFQAMSELAVYESIIITRNERNLFKKNGYVISAIPFWEWALMMDDG